MPTGIYKRKSFSKEHKQKMSIAKKGHKLSDETKHKISIALRGRKISKKWRQKISIAQKGRKQSEEHNYNVSLAVRGEKNSFYGKKHSQNTKRKMSAALKGRKLSKETKRKMRLSAIQRIERDRLNGNQLFPRFNPTACKKMDEYGELYGFNFQHAMNGGEFHIKELGYFVDGYDKEKNVVIEIDESHHNRTQTKDKKRQDEIVNLLGCKFIRLTLEQ